MPSDLSLRDRFWRDVAIAAGPRELDPRSVREAVEDMMRNYDLDEVPGFEGSPEARNLPNPDDFLNHSTLSPVFTRTFCNPLSPASCFNPARPIFVGHRRRRGSCSDLRHSIRPTSSGNPGIEATTDQANEPAHQTPAVNSTSPWPYPPPLPQQGPCGYIWATPTGHLGWSPYPQLYPPLPYPQSPWAAMPHTGGRPITGQTPQWTPGTWPPLDWTHDVPIRLSPHIIPNPNNPSLPLIDWDVTKHPSTAKRLTSNHVVVDMASIWGETVTDTKAHTVMVACDVGHMSTLWGPITVDQSKPVTLRDLFEAIYAYFQVQLTYPEVRYILDLHPNNYRRLTDAYFERCRGSTALAGWEAKQGYRRVDVLGDRRYWWGMWIASRNGTWWINLGLIHPPHSRRLS